jgi:hypothetical protein
LARTVSKETRQQISASMKGKRNAAGPHQMSDEGRQAIAEGQRVRWLRYYEERGEPIPAKFLRGEA